MQLFSDGVYQCSDYKYRVLGILLSSKPVRDILYMPIHLVATTLVRRIIARGNVHSKCDQGQDASTLRCRLFPAPIFYPLYFMSNPDVRMNRGPAGAAPVYMDGRANERS